MSTSDQSAVGQEASRIKPPTPWWGRPRNLIGGALVIGATLVIAYPYYAVTHKMVEPQVLEGPNLRFSVSSCQKSSAKPPPGVSEQNWSPHKEGVKAVKWESDGTLQVVGLIFENCSARVKRGGYALSGNTLSLAYRIEGSQVPAKCNCSYLLNYTISGIARSDYSIQFPTTGLSPE